MNIVQQFICRMNKNEFDIPGRGKNIFDEKVYKTHTQRSVTDEKDFQEKNKESMRERERKENP